MKIEYITEQDVTGLGRIVVDGKFYGVPAKAVELIKLEQEALRQRVKELEAGFDRTINEYEAELATLKQGQGEPVAWLWHHIDNETGMRFDRGLSFSKVDPTNDTFLDGNVSTTVQPLHTSAPTIPAEWQLVPKTLNSGMEPYICNCDNRGNQYADQQKNYDDLLSAAPKSGEE